MKGRATTDKELNDMVYSDNPWKRRTAAMNGYGLDILVHDKAPMVRAEVAFCNMLSFSTQYAKLLDFASVIDWHALTNNILKAGLKNVVDHGDVIYVLPDLK